MRSRRFLATFLALAATFSTVAIGRTGQASASLVPPDSESMLSWANFIRAQAGLPPVTLNPTWSEGARLHSCWMLQNGIAHDETPGTPGYTTAGDATGNSSNVATSSGTSTNGNFVKLWMSGPFHAIGILRPGLKSIGTGRCDVATPYAGRIERSAGTLDVLRGLDTTVKVTKPIMFPANGAVTTQTAFVAEHPDPRTFCGSYAGQPVGLPITVLLPESSAGATTTLTGPGGAVSACTLTQANTTGTAAALLNTNGVTILPRNPLVQGNWSVKVVTAARTLTWSFTVDPAGGADPVTGLIGTPVGYTSMNPQRIADSRTGSGMTALTGNTPQRVQVAGLAGIPSTSTAVSVNVAVYAPASAGTITVYGCGTRPTSSTLNFAAGATISNTTTVALDATGGICLHSSTGTHTSVDVGGYFSPAGTELFNPILPTRLVDTRNGTGGIARLTAGGTQTLTIAGRGGVSATASAVAVSVAAVNPAAAGSLTIWPCGSPRSSAVTQQYGAVISRSNNALVKLGTSGTVCVHSSQPTDLVVDATGFFAATGKRFQLVQPVRVADTRTVNYAISMGRYGQAIAAGGGVSTVLAGRFGLPAGTVAVAGSVVAANPVANGFVSVYPRGMVRPIASSLSYATGVSTANGGQFKLGGGGLTFFTSAGSHLIFDITGVWL